MILSQFVVHIFAKRDRRRDKVERSAMMKDWEISGFTSQPSLLMEPRGKNWSAGLVTQR